MEENHKIIGTYELGDYTIHYKGESVKLLEVRMEENNGIMFASGYLDECFGMFFINETKLTIKGLDLTITKLEIIGNVINIVFNEL